MTIDPIYQQPARAALLAIATLALLAGCGSNEADSGIADLSLRAAESRKPLRLTVLHTNDHHGHFWANSDGEYGLAARKTLIERVRAEVLAEGGQLLLLDGGDINTGTPESDMQDAEPDFKGMNLLGYDASAVGNHEFDKPSEVLQKQRGWAQFPLLSANIYKNGQRLFEPYRIFNKGGYRIAVVGLTTDDTAKITLPDNVRGIEFRRPAAELVKLMPEVTAQADMVIATTHMGHYPDGSASAPGDVTLAREVSGIDLIVGGHSQNAVCMLAENERNPAYLPGQPCAPDRQNGAWIVQAHEWGKYLGRADFVIEAGKVQLTSYQLLPVNLKKTAADGSKLAYTDLIPEDQHVRSFLEPYRMAARARLSMPIAESDGRFEGARDKARFGPTNLGVLVARAMQERVGADLALMNSGGLRDSLAAGTITYRDILNVLPFGNTVAVVRLSGRELLAYLQAVARMAPGSAAFAQTSGVRMRIEGNVLQDARVGDAPIAAEREYRLAITRFTAAGGDGYPRLDNHPGYIDTGYVEAEVLRAYLESHSPLKVSDYAPGDAVERRGTEGQV